MSRHRNVRSMNVNEEYDGYDDVYGHSVEDDYCVSPSEAAFMYDREGSKNKQRMGAFFQSVTDIAEENEGESESREVNLSDFDKTRLESCIEHITQVIGFGIQRQELVKIILLYNFNVEKSMNFILGCPQYKHLTEKKDDVLHKKSLKNFTIPKLNTKLSINFKREPLKSDSSNFSSLNELSRCYLQSVSTTTDGFKTNFKGRLAKPLVNNVNALTNDFNKVNVDDDRVKSPCESKDVLDNCHVDLTKALRGVTSAPQLRISKKDENIETFTPSFIDCEIVIPQPRAEMVPKKLSTKIRYKEASAFAKVLCLSYRRPVPYVSHKSDTVYSGIPHFLFDCPSPDDLRTRALYNHLKRQK